MLRSRIFDPVLFIFLNTRRSRVKIFVLGWRVRVGERWILGVLRSRQFFSFEELDTTIGLPMDPLNYKPFKKLHGSRRTGFEAVYQPVPLLRLRRMKKRTRPYRLPHWGWWPPLLGIVPVGEAPLEVRLTALTVECFHTNQRVASHLRLQHNGRHTIQTEHMPKRYSEYAE
jgi:hypothetical protein